MPAVPVDDPGEPDDFVRSQAAHQEATPEHQEIVKLFYDTHLCRADPTGKFAESGEIVAKSIAYRVMNGPNEFHVIGVIRDFSQGARPLEKHRPAP